MNIDSSISSSVEGRIDNIVSSSVIPHVISEKRQTIWVFQKTYETPHRHCCLSKKKNHVGQSLVQFEQLT